ncbi:hypothetical protein [Micromonospora sp. NPDC049679]|uniref:hypothetical protein n=1 Tax=Micromonospora sp. NPDC049679 TaxID=3155920 RepID=UPI0033CBF86F
MTAEDERFAVLAVVVHAAEEWPAGPVCRNERVPHPCRLNRWGREVLRLRGLSDAQIDELPQTAVAGRRAAGELAR